MCSGVIIPVLSFCKYPLNAYAGPGARFKVLTKGEIKRICKLTIDKKVLLEFDKCYIQSILKVNVIPSDKMVF